MNPPGSRQFEIINKKHLTLDFDRICFRIKVRRCSEDEPALLVYTDGVMHRDIQYAMSMTPVGKNGLDVKRYNSVSLSEALL